MTRVPAVILLLAAVPAASAAYTLEDSQTFLKTYCAGCHSGNKPAGGFNASDLTPPASLNTQAERWTRVLSRVRINEMPPRGSPAPDLALRENFTKWIDETLHAQTCSTGPAPGPAPIRRLNRDEYTATIRELLDVHLNVGHDLPADGAGGEGFDNAAEVLFLSPVLAEKYMDAAKRTLEFAIRDSRARTRLAIVEPSAALTPIVAARNILNSFLPRAFRRPVAEHDTAVFLDLFRTAQRDHQTFDNSVVYMLRGVLMSPQFLFISAPPNPTHQPRPLDDYALASRLSYFLWGSMPDEMLFDLAGLGKLHEPAVLKEEIGRMLRSPRAMGFVESFISQWLGTRALGREFTPDAKLFPNYATDAELRADIGFQPTVFFQTMLSKDAPLTDLLDSNWTILTRKLATLYGFDLKKLPKELDEQPKRVDLPADSHRGGLLGMAAVLTVSSYPYRTSPVLRGKWVLDSILGTPPPPPPPNVPTLEEHVSATQPQTMRERLAQHRANPVCAGCHSRIDPLGFALENYDALGQWRTEEAGKPIDNTGELTDGTRFAGPDELRAILLVRKDLFLRNLTSRMLGFALGRGLTRKDSCAVDAILAQLSANGYKSQALIEAVVMSPVFRDQAAAD